LYLSLKVAVTIVRPLAFFVLVHVYASHL